MDEKLTLAAASPRLAEEDLAVALLAGRAGLYRNAISSLCYVAHHADSALLAAHGLEARTREGVQTRFGLHFVEPGAIGTRAGKYLGTVLHARLTADYKGYVDLDREAFAQASAQAKRVVTAVADHLDRHFPDVSVACIRGLAAELRTRCGSGQHVRRRGPLQEALLEQGGLYDA